MCRKVFTAPPGRWSCTGVTPARADTRGRRDRRSMDLEEALLGQQGVVSRRQLLNLGFDDDFIEKKLRRRDWARVHRGVYIDHTGPLSWLQRLWAAVLLAAPAAADSRSALVLHGLVTPSATEIVHVVVPDDRRVQAPAGIHVRTLHDWSEHVH